MLLETLFEHFQENTGFCIQLSDKFKFLCKYCEKQAEAEVVPISSSVKVKLTCLCKLSWVGGWLEQLVIWLSQLSWSWSWAWQYNTLWFPMCSWSITLLIFSQTWEKAPSSGKASRSNFSRSTLHLLRYSWC